MATQKIICTVLLVAVVATTLFGGLWTSAEKLQTAEAPQWFTQFAESLAAPSVACFGCSGSGGGPG